MLFLKLMKTRIFIILIFTSSILFSQINTIEILINKQNENPTQAIFYADSLLLTNPSKQDAILIKYYQANAYQNNNNPKRALSIFKEILPLFKSQKEFFIKILLGQSDANTRIKNYAEATNQALKALEIAKKEGSHKLIGSANTSLSFIYYANKDYTRSLKYILNSVELQKRIKDSISLSASYNNIAIIYKNMGEFDKAINYNNLSLEISKLKKSKIGIGKSYSNIGRIYGIIGKRKKAIKYYNLAIENNKNSNIKNSIPFRNIGDIYLEQKKFNKAEKYYLNALKIETDNHQNNLLSNIHKDLQKVALLKKDYKNALIYQKKADLIDKSNVEQANEEKIKMLEYQHKLFKNTEVLRQEKKSNKKNKIIFGILTSLLLLIGLFIIQKTKNKKLNTEKEKLILEQRVLRSQMNPHFIFNALSAIQNSLLDNEPIKSASYLSKFAKLIRQNFDFINEKTILLTNEIDALQNYMDTQKMRYSDKFDYEINIFSDVDINAVEIPPLLIQPFIENAIEHGFKNIKNQGKIILNISKNKDCICYEIKDNGKGINNAKDDNKQHSIDIFKKRLALLDGNSKNLFKIESSEKGTKINFCIKEFKE